MPQYIAEINWECSGRELHTEYATISIEEHDLGDEPIKNLEDLGCPEEDLEGIFQSLKQIAETQNMGYMCSAHIVAIYRIGAILNEESSSPSDEKKLTFLHLKPIFRFDENGENPVRVP